MGAKAKLGGQKYGLVSSLYPQVLTSALHGLDPSFLLHEWSSSLTGTYL